MGLCQASASQNFPALAPPNELRQHWGSEQQLIKLRSFRNPDISFFLLLFGRTFYNSRLTRSGSIEVAHLGESVFFAAPEEPSMNRYGLRPSIRIGIELLGSRGAVYE
jgi:hypothetical protein